VVLFSLSTVAFAQQDKQSAAGADMPDAATHSQSEKPLSDSEAQTVFAKLKAIAGSWQGTVTTDPPDAFPKNPDPAKNVMNVTLRVTSMGNAIMHEMTSPARPDDPITMLYVDGDKLLLTHYCDAGNRPRMVGQVSPDGTQVEFNFVDITGPMKHGHMQRAMFTLINENHHKESWTFRLPDGKVVTGHFDLKRTKSAEVASR